MCSCMVGEGWFAGREDTASGACSHSPYFASPRALHLDSPFRISVTLPAELPLQRSSTTTCEDNHSSPKSHSLPHPPARTCRFSQPGSCWPRPPWAPSPPRTSRSMSPCLSSVIARPNPATKCRCTTEAPLLPMENSSMRVCQTPRGRMLRRIASCAPLPPTSHRLTCKVAADQKFLAGYDRGTPFSFKLGSGQVIKGFVHHTVAPKQGAHRAGADTGHTAGMKAF